MTERATRDTRIALLDKMMREIVWHIQKLTAHTLTRPEIHLTLPQMVTLFAIHNSGTSRMSALAESTQQSAGTLTGIVDRLIDEGLVTRTRNATDRRVVEVMLTPAGEARLDQVIGARHENMARILKQFNDDDLATLERLLKALLKGIQTELGPVEPLPKTNEP